MAGGQRIDDHSSWIGKGKDGVVYPAGAKMKQYNSAEGAGAENNYEDTTEKIKEQQVECVKKAKAHPMKPGYRH